ncbi:MAG TPA: protein kinase [Candidatus Xenobia bacterium]|jgi:WD40 repeat protein
MVHSIIFVLVLEDLGDSLPNCKTKCMKPEAQTQVSIHAPAPAPVDVRTWQPGENVLGLYEVRHRLGEGGMGVVYRVRHRQWGIDLAVKSPRAEILARPGGPESFIFEAENWVKLGLHPHIVSCYYVRVLEGVPRVFAEYVEGGDLHEWVINRRLYQGTEVLRRILDVAIQFAWGLAYAHSLGLIHQDVKPANVLVTSEGQVKVTDFGLSRALLASTASAAIPAEGSSTAGRTSPFTPAYASPEQTRNEPLTYKTDLWSWGVSVLEMFLGHSPNWGPLALYVLEDYLEGESGEARMPARLENILRACFQENPDLRPHDFHEVAAELVAIYQEEVGEAYPRAVPDAASNEADALNNRAVSLLDLGLPEEALPLLEQALVADGRHGFAWYNRALVQWRTGRISDEAALNAMRDLETALGARLDDKLNTAWLHLERGDEGGARRLLSEAARLAPPHDASAQDAMDTLAAHLTASVGPRLRLDGHAESVLGVAVSPTGEVVVTGSQDRTVRAWLPDQGEKAWRVLRGHQAPIYAVAVSPDGRFAYSAAEDGAVVVWDIEAGRPLAHLRGHQGAVWCLSLAQNGQVTCSGGQDGTARMWESVSGREVRRFDHGAPVTAIYASGNARMVVTGLENGTLVVWDTSTHQAIRTLTGHEGPIRGVGLLQQGRVAVTAGTDGTVRVWNLERGELVRTLSGHRGAIESLAVEPEGRWVATGGEDRTVRLWDLNAPRCWRTIETHAGRVYAVGLAGGRLRVAAANADRVADLWDVIPDPPAAPPAVVRPRRSEELLEAQSGYHQILQGAYQALERGDTPAALDELRQARQSEGFERSPEALELWAWLAPFAARGTLLGNWLLQAVEGAHAGRVTGIQCVPSGQRAVSVGEDGLVKVWDLGRVAAVETWQTHAGPLLSLAMDRFGTRALLVTDSGVLLWDLEQGGLLRHLVGHRGPIGGVAIDAQGRRGVTTSKDGTARVWDLDSGETLHSIEGQGEAVALRPDGGALAWGSPGGTCRVFDLATRQLVSTMRGHEGPVRAVAFDLGGGRLVTGSEDKTVRVWDVATGGAVKTLKGHHRGVTSVAFALDGRVAVSASKDKTLMLWDVRRGQSLGSLVGHQDVVTAAALSADGRLVLSGCLDGSVRLWYLDWELVPWGSADLSGELEPWVRDFRTRHMAFHPTDPLTRRPPAHWTEEDFQALFVELGYAGLGGLAPEFVHAALTA